MNLEEIKTGYELEFDGAVVASSLQTGLFAGPVGSGVGQLQFSPDLAVREAQENVRLYTPQSGLFEIRAKAIGRDVGPDQAKVGMGLHPFGDPRIVDEFAAEPVAIDAREFHVYAAEWTHDHVAFFVDGEHVKTVRQSPSYPMQLMLGV